MPASGKIKPLTPAELAVFGRRLYGQKNWKIRMSRDLGVEPSTITRWAHGSRKIPQPAAIAIRSLYARLRAQRAMDQA